MILAFALATALAQNPTGNPTPSFRAWRDDQGWRTGRSNGRSGAGSLLLEFAPASGAGMGAACACTAVTGAKGETMTFTRAGDATCSKQGLATTGIANGDLAVCTANQPRVESSGGVLGLRVEGARTNEALRSAEWANAVWLSASGGVAAPTVTADQAVAPDGTTTAERIQVPATTSGQYSYVYQNGFSSVQRTTSFYVKGNGGSGSINLLSGTTPNACISCAYVADSWTRCSLPSSTTASTFFFVGNDSASAVCTTSSKGAVDAFVWGAQHETGLYATSYIPTVAAAVTRNAELPYLTLPVTVSPGSIAATTQVPFTTPGANRRNLGVRSGTSDANRFELFYTNGGPGASTYTEVASVGLQVDGVTAPALPGSNRFAAWRVPASTLNVITNGTTASGATVLGAFPVLDRVYLGAYISAGSELEGVISRVCVDPDSSRCR